MLILFSLLFLKLTLFDVAELAEYLGKGGVFNLLEGVSDMLIKFDFTGAGAAFKEIQNLSLAFR